ncbi:MAG: glycosyltransferase family 2 protein [Gemmatimonadota bacterium]|nr:glycosyltransferase family 2 protein [Gemmatimonadota bacterium]
MLISAADTSLVIATYNWPAALGVVLRSVRAQRVLPGEVVIADDGSREDTRTLIAREAPTFPVPLHHVWHEDVGFRLGMIRNKAMARAQGAYILQLDGDMVLHPEFVASQVAFARTGEYVQGSRVMLDAAQTTAAIAAGRVTASPWSPGVRNRINAVHAPALAAFVRGPTDPLRRTRGCNMAFWRDDIVRVNGYNEAIEGWGREDSELAARLQNAGVRRRNLKFAAVAWHLHHAVYAQDALGRNHAAYERAVRERLMRCDRGISQWMT